MNVQFDRAKLKAAILYTCQKCEAGQLGAVKLNKVLYFADMLHYAHVGTSITGSQYRKRSFGPTNDQILVTLAELKRQGAIEIRDVDYFGYIKKEYIAVESPDTSRFSNIEKFLLDDVIEFVCFNHSAKTISEFSHNKAWELTKFGEVIPYNSVFHLFPTEVSLETMEWASAEVKKIEDQKSSGSPLGVVPFGDLRRRVLETVRGK
jgi:Antitoxin SocA-like, Panacea domain